MATETDRRPLLAYLKVQRATDREVIALLRSSAASISRELNRLAMMPGVGAAVRRDQLQMTMIAIQREIGGLWRGVGNVVAAAQANAAAASIEASFDPSRLRAVMPPAEVRALLDAARQQARASAATVQARANLSRRSLAETVYRSSDLASGRVDQIVNDALARGASARELARDVRAFVRPNTPGGARYAALRLGRTELNNAFHAQQVLSGTQIPWTTGLKWNLSSSHPRTDGCNDYAEGVHFPGGDPGVFKPSETPGKLHPNCLCYLTTVQNSREQFIDEFLSGSYDAFLDDVTRGGIITVR